MYDPHTNEQDKRALEAALQIFGEESSMIVEVIKDFNSERRTLGEKWITDNLNIFGMVMTHDYEPLLYPVIERGVRKIYEKRNPGAVAPNRADRARNKELDFSKEYPFEYQLFTQMLFKFLLRTFYPKVFETFWNNSILPDADLSPNPSLSL